MTFPKLIHIVWFQGLAGLSRPAFVTNVKNWQILNPDWKVHCLDDDALKDQCRLHSPAALKAYSSFKTMHQKIDFGRFVTLFNLGGIYVDMDAYAFRPLTYNESIRQLIQKHEIGGQPMLGLSSVSTTALEAYVLSKGASTKFINNAVMMGSPRHPDLGRFIDMIIGIVESNPSVGLQDSTGPLIFGKFFNSLVKNDNDNGNVILFAPHIFEPCSIDGTCRINDDTVALHQYEMSWLSKFLRDTVKWYVRHSKLIWALAIIAASMYILRVQVRLPISEQVHTYRYPDL